MGRIEDAAASVDAAAVRYTQDAMRAAIASMLTGKAAPEWDGVGSENHAAHTAALVAFGHAVLEEATADAEDAGYGSTADLWKGVARRLDALVAPAAEGGQKEVPMGGTSRTEGR